MKGTEARVKSVNGLVQEEEALATQTLFKSISKLQI